MLDAGRLADTSSPTYVPRRPLPTDQAAGWLGVSDQTVRNLFLAGQLEGYRVGRKILVYADSVEDYKTRHGNLRPTPAPALPEPEAPPEPVPEHPPTRRRRRGVRDFDRHARR